MKTKNTIHLLRHATLYIQIAGLKLLIDPMLSSKEAMEPVQN
jgi:L-ascorbate metabolism protein UlaG (beta-lactamase superfamily)